MLRDWCFSVHIVLQCVRRGSKTATLITHTSDLTILSFTGGKVWGSVPSFRFIDVTQVPMYLTAHTEIGNLPCLSRRYNDAVEIILSETSHDTDEIMEGSVERPWTTTMDLR